jgi:hypothetical protein
MTREDVPRPAEELDLVEAELDADVVTNTGSAEAGADAVEFGEDG